MAVFTVAALAAVLPAPDIHQAWKELLTQGWTRVLSYLAWLSLSYHAWVGMTDIWRDYVKPLSMRLALNLMTACWLAACAVNCAQVLWHA